MCPFRNENIELLKSLKGWSYSHMAAVSGFLSGGLRISARGIQTFPRMMRGV